MTTQTEAFKRYLDDCDKHAIVPDIAGAFHFAWQEALAQPEQEPDKYVMDIECTKCGAKQSGVLTVNTTPPQRTWVGLTDEEINTAASVQSWKPFAKAIEAKLRSKNENRMG